MLFSKCCIENNDYLSVISASHAAFCVVCTPVPHQGGLFQKHPAVMCLCEQKVGKNCPNVLLNISGIHV